MNREIAEEQEIICMLDALCDGSIELNKEFLTRLTGENVREQLLRLPLSERGYSLDNAIDEDNCFFNGSPASNCKDGIWLNIAEIEIQFEGDAREYFEDIDDWYISGDLAYLYVGYGLTVNVDVATLKECIDDYLEV